ncbi:hypothetical protein DFP74_3834 [Nocardiopsis sp. Huas11]|uniref:Uncharacterized protein n=1 Tax=Nocardiopsis aegyptia TaxID=220378 RepID=A0A7Z0JCY3_9ACTN|nr:hypothetical protein [Nocardiopsis aegyptia]RKS08140.1 hypothetical protein DFP74_3834 [Nocardiopsis sp. Huas11]
MACASLMMSSPIDPTDDVTPAVEELDEETAE